MATARTAEPRRLASPTIRALIRQRSAELTGLVLDKSRLGGASPLHRLMTTKTFVRGEGQQPVPMVTLSRPWPRPIYALANGVERRNVAVLQQRQSSFLSWAMAE